MGYLKYVKKLWQKPDTKAKELRKQRLIGYRQETATVRVQKPTRIDRARSLGYKAKQGFIIVRQRVARGGHSRPHDQRGRRPKHNRRNMVLNKSYQQICEERANKKFTNCEVLNSYYIEKDGKHIWYEVILIDRTHPQILANNNLKNLVKKKGRTFRGLTSAGRKSRHLDAKGKGTEKMRPSKSAVYRKKHRKDAPKYRKRDNNNNK
jgi:large subunit ribosomal protein L15e